MMGDVISERATGDTRHAPESPPSILAADLPHLLVPFHHVALRLPLPFLQLGPLGTDGYEKQEKKKQDKNKWSGMKNQSSRGDSGIWNSRTTDVG